MSASFGLRAFQLQTGDNVRITNTRFGWINKEFEVVSWSFGVQNEYDLQIELVLRETAESVFDEVDDGIVYERDNTTLLSPFTVWYGSKVDHLLMPGCPEVENSYQDPFPSLSVFQYSVLIINGCGLEMGAVLPHKKRAP